MKAYRRVALQQGRCWARVALLPWMRRHASFGTPGIFQDSMPMNPVASVHLAGKEQVG